VNLLEAIKKLVADGGYIKRNYVHFPLLAFAPVQNTASKKNVLSFVHIIGHGELLRSNDAHCLSDEDYTAEDWVHLPDIDSPL